MEHWEPREWVEQMGGPEALGHYFGGVGEGGPWQDYPQLLKGKQKVSVEDMKVRGSGLTPIPTPTPNPNPEP